MAKLIAMTRYEPSFPDGPVTADVHPDEVENMRAAGWHVADSAKSGDAPRRVASVPRNVARAFDAMESEPDAWTDANLPKADRLSELLGTKVSAADRDKWWSDYQASKG